MPDQCAHIAAVTSVKHAKRRECEDCVKMGGQWVHLRSCQTCGGTRCCDNSPNRHATKHGARVRPPKSTKVGSHEAPARRHSRQLREPLLGR